MPTIRISKKAYKELENIPGNTSSEKIDNLMFETEYPTREEIEDMIEEKIEDMKNRY